MPVRDRLPSTADQRQALYVGCGLVLLASVFLIGATDHTNRYELTAEPAETVSDDVREYVRELEYYRLDDDAQAVVREAVESGEARTANPVSDRISYTHPRERHYEYSVEYRGESYVLMAVETGGSGLLFVLRTYQVTAALAGGVLLVSGLLTRSSLGRRGLGGLGVDPTTLERRFLATVYVSLLLPVLMPLSIIPLLLPAYVVYTITPEILQNTEIDISLLRAPTIIVPPVWAGLVLGFSHLRAEFVGLAFLFMLSIVIAVWSGIWFLHDTGTDDGEVRKVL